MIRSVGRGCLLGAAALLGSACGGLSDGDVADVAAQFTAADPAGKCELLTPAALDSLVEEEQTECADAISEVPVGSGGLVSVEVWGDEAQARLDDDTLFLTRTGDGWRVAAGACSPPRVEDGPYDCQLEGA